MLMSKWIFLLFIMWVLVMVIFKVLVHFDWSLFQLKLESISDTPWVFAYYSVWTSAFLSKTHKYKQKKRLTTSAEKKKAETTWVWRVDITCFIISPASAVKVIQVVLHKHLYWLLTFSDLWFAHMQLVQKLTDRSVSCTEHLKKRQKHLLYVIMHLESLYKMLT